MPIRNMLPFRPYYSLETLTLSLHWQAAAPSRPADVDVLAVVRAEVGTQLAGLEALALLLAQVEGRPGEGEGGEGEAEGEGEGEGEGEDGAEARVEEEGERK
jgi:hypothetical protein